MKWLSWVLDTGSFHPPQASGGWTPGLIWLTESSNAVIGLAFLTIAGVILYSHWKNQTNPVWRRLLPSACSFAAFIGFCGLSRGISALSFFWPAYRLIVGLNLVTALAAFWALVVLVPTTKERFMAALEEMREADMHLGVQVGLAQIEPTARRLERLADTLVKRERVLNEAIQMLNRMPALPEGPDAG